MERVKEKVTKICDFVYRKRYILAAIFLVLVVLFKLSGSSIGTYSAVIQEEAQSRSFMPIFGDFRSIRSDEWSVNTPIHMSQVLSGFKYKNDSLRGTTTDMFLISSPPILDITTLGRLFNIGYILFGAERGLSFLWYGKLTALVLVAFEFCMLLTNKKKLASFAGMIAIVFSAATQWWYSAITDFFIWGMLAVVLFDKFMLTKELKYKLLSALGLFICGISYIFILYPAWMISFGYVYLGLIIWVFLKNKKEYKINFKDILILVIVLILMALLVFRFYTLSKDGFTAMMSTDYPGERFELGGKGGRGVFSYAYSILFPYVEINNPCEASGMLSFFPMPIIVAILYLIRNFKKKDFEKMKFLIPMILVTGLLSLWTFFENSRILAKLTFLYMVPPTRCCVPLGFAVLIILIYLLGNLNKEDVVVNNKIIKRIIAVLTSIFVMYFAVKIDNSSDMVLRGFRIYICGIITLYGIYQVMNINQEEGKRRTIATLIVVGLLTGATVNPIQYSTSVLTSKPIAKEVQKIVEEDSENNLWICDNTEFFISNYFIANGAKVLNSTNVYPNFELYKTVLGEDSEKEEIRKIYNRYAHLKIEISNENKLELLYPDSIKLYLTTEKAREIGIHYVITTRSLEEFSDSYATYNRLYNEYGMYIYELEYK